MKKTAFKTFVCSFVFSLFILFTINGLFLHTPEIPSQDIKIPSKNISLFFTGAADNARAAHIRPIKKIALSIPQKEKKATIETVYAPASQPTPSPAAPQVDTHQKEPIQDNVPIFDEIPLEIAQEGTAYYFRLKGYEGKTFYSYSETHPNIRWKAKKVRISYNPTDADLISIEKYDVLHYERQ